MPQKIGKNWPVAAYSDWVVSMNNLGASVNSTAELSGFEAIYESFQVADQLRDTSRQILDLAAHLTGAENCSLMVLNGQGELYVLNARGLRQANLRASRAKLGEGIAGQVASSGDPLLVENIAGDARFASYGRDNYRTGSFIACPITSREKVIGVLNLNDKQSGSPFDAADFDQAKVISTIAAVALRSFLVGSALRLPSSEIADIYKRLVEAECNNREFLARLAHDIRTPLTNIKGTVYYLKTGANPKQGSRQEFYEIIEKEVNYLISYLDEGTSNYERMRNRLLDLEEREKYRHLLG